LEKAVLLQELSHEFLIADSAKCRIYALQALELAQNIGSKQMEGAAHKVLGDCYLNKNPYFAHAHYKEAERLFLKLDDREYLFRVYHNFMLLFYMIDDMKNTTFYANKVLEMVAERENGEYEAFAAEFFIGMARFKDNEGQEALDYYLSMYRKAIRLNGSYYTQYIAWYCGKLYILQNRPREALQYLHLIRKFFESDKANIMPENYASCAEAYAMLNQIDSAEYYIKKTLNAPILTDEARLILQRTHSLLESGKGDYRAALESYKKYHHLSDSIVRAGKTAETGRLKNWYELEQKDAENKHLQEERQMHHKRILNMTIALIMILALLILFVFYYRKTVEHNREMKKLHTIKNKLFSVMAHDLRSPMGALVTMLKLANKKKLDTETQAQLLQDISNRVDNTFDLLDNLLRWVKSQMQGMIPAPVHFDVQEESHTVTDTLQDVAVAKMITLNNRIEKHQVYADKDMFDVVVRNLTSNAIKYTSANGTITLASELVEKMLVVSVKDTGTGMSQSVQDKLFKLSETQSQRGTNNESGTGLGLVLCAEFVKANGGNIWFSSVQNEGSTFFFSVPV